VGYEYYNVSQQTWQNFKRVKSPGKAINRYFPPGSNYARADW
jgi:surface antigen